MPALLAPSLRSRERTRPERLHRMCPPALASDREESAWVARQGRPERETRRLGCVEYTSATTTYSRTTSFASLSVRSPRKTGWRSWSSNVHSVNLTWATSTALNPLAAFHDGRGNPQAPPAFAFLRQVDKRARRHPELLKLRVEIR